MWVESDHCKGQGSMPDQTWIFQVLFQLLRFFIQLCGSCSLSYLCPQFKIRSVSFISKPLSIKINLLPTLKKTNNMGKNWDQDRFWFWSLMMWEEKPESKINNGEYHYSLFSERSVTIGKYVHNTSLDSCHWRVLQSCLFCILDEFSHFFLSLRKMQSKKLFFL